MPIKGRGKFLNYVSLIISLLALLLAGTQTIIQYSASDVPLRANLQIMQMEACTKIVEKLIRFSNNNAEQRLLIAMTAGKEPVSIGMLNKQNLNGTNKSNEELELDRVQRQGVGYELASDLNLALLSQAHLFPTTVRAILDRANSMILSLATEPEGNNESSPKDFNSSIEEFRALCKRLGQPEIKD